MKKLTWILVLLVLGLPAVARAQSPGTAAARDSIWDGAFKGAIWGGAVAGGALAAVFFSNNAPHGCNGDCFPIVAATVGAGAAIGLALDALVSNRIAIYAPSPLSQGFIGVTRRDRSIGAGVRVRF
jgi:hypothetical protein